MWIRSDISVLSQIGWDFADNPESHHDTFSRYLNETELFQTLLQRVTIT